MPLVSVVAVCHLPNCLGPSVRASPSVSLLVSLFFSRSSSLSTLVFLSLGLSRSFGISFSLNLSVSRSLSESLSLFFVVSPYIVFALSIGALSVSSPFRHRSLSLSVHSILFSPSRLSRLTDPDRGLATTTIRFHPRTRELPTIIHHRQQLRLIYRLPIQSVFLHFVFRLSRETIVNKTYGIHKNPYI